MKAKDYRKVKSKPDRVKFKYIAEWITRSVSSRQEENYGITSHRDMYMKKSKSIKVKYRHFRIAGKPEFLYTRECVSLTKITGRRSSKFKRKIL